MMFSYGFYKLDESAKFDDTGNFQQTQNQVLSINKFHLVDLGNVFKLNFE